MQQASTKIAKQSSPLAIKERLKTAGGKKGTHSGWLAPSVVVGVK